MISLFILFFNSIGSSFALDAQYFAPIMDTQRIVTPSNLTKYNYYLNQLYEKDKVKVSIVVLDTVPSFDFNQFSLNSYYELNLGDDKYNGVVMIVAVKEGKISITSGKNIQLPESKKEKISKEMRDLLKKGKIESALLHGTNRLIEKTTKNQDLFNDARKRVHEVEFDLSFVLATFTLIYFLIALFFQKILWGKVFFEMMYRWRPDRKNSNKNVSYRKY